MGHVVRFTEIAAQFGRNTEDEKKIVTHARGTDALCFHITGGAGQIRVPTAEKGKISEPALAGAPIEIIRQANRTGIEDICALANEHEAVRLWIRQWPQQNCIDHAENCGIRANGERQRQDCDRTKTRLLPQHTESVSNILFHFVKVVR